MRFTPAHSYAVSALLYLAEQNTAASIAATELCKECDLPRACLGQVLGKLTRAGLLVSTKGAAGGYELAMQPTEISLLSIIEAVDNVFDVKSHLEIGGLDADSVEAVERTLAEIAASARSILSSTTLTSLLAAKAA